MPSPFPNLPAERRGTLHHLIHHSKVLEGNLWDDPTARDLYVYTPPGFDPARRYPAIFVLPGFTGTGEGQLARGLTDISIATRADRLIASGTPPFLMVLPDCMTTVVGSQYVDSPGIGRYATYVAEELRGFVEERFPVSAWGVAGKSSGGFGALHLVITFPGVFRAAASHAGDVGFDLCYLGDLGALPQAVLAAGGLQAFLEGFWSKQRPSGTDVGAMNVICMACAYSPDPTARPVPARLPVDPETGEVDFDVLHAWRRLDPLVRVEREEAQDALRRLDLLYLDAGDRDEYNLQLGARRLVRRLTALGIPHHHEEFRGTHRGTSWRYDTSLDRMARALG